MIACDRQFVNYLWLYETFDLFISLTLPLVRDKILTCKPPSSSGPGRGPLKAKTRIRIPLGAPGLIATGLLTCGFVVPLTPLQAHETKTRSRTPAPRGVPLGAPTLIATGLLTCGFVVPLTPLQVHETKTRSRTPAPRGVPLGAPGLIATGLLTCGKTIYRDAHTDCHSDPRIVGEESAGCS